ncbi:patatin-like phospholipase family protein [Streptomyces sp. NPDC046977]|uniref:patatin-like phospholipase family protein n=1 Tax=Streptomyces sp. NPDC046977 TaxID=3154703 RepID=UPI00340169D7
MKLGIILGGGGQVGIAWETAVLAALTQHAGLDVNAAAVIAGTSAGAFVGATAASGADLAALTDQEIIGSTLSPVPPPPPAQQDSGTGTAVVPDDITKIVTSREGTVRERSAAVGQLALAATPVVDEETYLQLLATMFTPREWPATTDLRITSAHCTTGETVLWSRNHGIDLMRAVASSCAIPGFFPPVQHNGDYYCDAPRTPFCATLAETEQLDRILFIGPDIPVLAGMDEKHELDRLKANGTPVVAITGSPSFDEVGKELMDAAARPRAAEIGLQDGHAAAAEVISLLW